MYDNPIQIKLSPVKVRYGYFDVFEGNSWWGNVKWYTTDNAGNDVTLYNCGTHNYITVPCAGDTEQIWTLYFNTTNVMLTCNNVVVFRLRYPSGDCKYDWSQGGTHLVFGGELTGAKYRAKREY